MKHLPPAQSLLPLVHRLLAFDEPATKWVAAQKYMRKFGIEFPDRHLAEKLSDLYRTEIGTALPPQLERAAATLSQAFFLEEGSRFTSCALESWHLKNGHLPSRNPDPNFNPNNLVLAWAESFACGPVLAAWLATESAAADERLDLLKSLLGAYTSAPKEPNAYEVAAQLRELVEARRARLPGSFLPNLIIYVEGPTEAALLPTLCSGAGFDMHAAGALIVAAGGANQVLKRYLFGKEVFSLPIFCLLDRDALDQGDLIRDNLRAQDELHILGDGEIEDIVSVEILVPLLNSYIDSLPIIANDLMPIKTEHFVANAERTKILERLWRERDLGKFDKAGFARFAGKHVAHALQCGTGLSADGKELISKLRHFAQKHPDVKA